MVKRSNSRNCGETEEDVVTKASGITSRTIAAARSSCAACGISGPALYKHFTSKQSVLAEMLVSISEELLRVGTERARESDPIAALVDWHVDFALRHRALIVVQDRDWESLPSEARERVRRLQRQYVDLWAQQLRVADHAPDLPTARAMAHAAFGLINSTPHSALLPDEQMRGVLTRMALAALRG